MEDGSTLGAKVWATLNKWDLSIEWKKSLETTDTLYYGNLSNGRPSGKGILISRWSFVVIIAESGLEEFYSHNKSKCNIFKYLLNTKILNYYTEAFSNNKGLKKIAPKYSMYYKTILDRTGLWYDSGGDSKSDLEIIINDDELKNLK